MTELQTRAQEAASDYEHVATLQDEDFRIAWFKTHGPTALAALRAVAGGQEAWQAKAGAVYLRHKDDPERISGLRPVLIVELPHD